MTKRTKAGTGVAAVLAVVSIAAIAIAKPIKGEWVASEITFKVKGQQANKIKNAQGSSSLDCAGQMFWGFTQDGKITIENNKFEYVDKHFSPASGPDYVLTFKGKTQGPDTIKGSYQVSKRLTCTSNKVEFVAHPTL